MEVNFKPFEVINEDGTEISLPEVPEYTALKEKYPRCEWWGYDCMFCGKCPYGDYFKPSNEEEKLAIEKQSKATNEYICKHNLSIKELIERNKK